MAIQFTFNPFTGKFDAIDVFNNNPIGSPDSIASSATPTIDTDAYNFFSITALATDITSMTTNLSGAPIDGQKLIIRIKDDGTSRAIAWGAKFIAKGATLPTATPLGKELLVGLIYNSVTAVFGCVATSYEV